MSVHGDNVPEPDETILVKLTSPTNAKIGRGTDTLTPLNDD